MKVIGHSLILPNPVPYMHLGYIAAMPLSNTAPFWIGAVLFLYLAAAAGGKRPSVRKTFLVLMCLTLAGVPFAWMHGMKEYNSISNKARISSSHSSARQVMMALDMAAEDGGELSTDLSTLRRYGCETTDAWDRPLRLVRQGEGKLVRYEIHSDGPDKTPGTKDDLSWGYEPQKKGSV